MGRTPPGQTRDRVFRYVREQLAAGVPPTVREVQRAFGFRSAQTAREHLEVLVREGRLKKRQGQSRGYRLPTTGSPMRLVPLLGAVQAGRPNEAIEDPEGHVQIQSRHAPGRLFALRVRGESMNGAGILPGDIVIVRRQPTAENGEIVVALVDGEATVKRLRVRRNRAELHPDNPGFEILAPDRFELVGKVIEVRRFLDAL